MASAAPTAPASVRLSWLDGMKGISILWIVFFHFFGTYANGRYPDPLAPHYFSSFVSQCAPSSSLGTFGCIAKGFFVATSLVGFHAVAVFLVLSGFGLTYSLARTGEPDGGWFGWYRGRLLRLFPMYWLAHLVYLVSPFIARPEPLDYRFVLSFLGDRIYPLDMIFFYLNPAWWYFGLLLELYLVFPLLFRLLQKLGTVWFLVLCGMVTLISRYALLCVISANGYYVQGAFFGARLWEFAAGMALGLLYRRHQVLTEERLFTGWAFLAGVALYTLGLYSYATTLSYTVTDPLIGTGLFIILAHVTLWSGLLPRLGGTLAYIGAFSYGLYLLHQPYVIYCGERMRGLSLPVFIVLACVIIALITMGAIPVERYVNQLTSRVLDRKRESRQTVKEGARQPAA
ncbi:MAG TPA: acyltransferase [Candidatus Binatia bacterium]|nr:acyltransferase [Candidatus Binatia bacterium]